MASLDTYVFMKIFGLFRDRMVPLINQYRRNKDNTEELHHHIFVAPESYSKKRAFQVKGVLSPFVCLWATSPLKYTKEFYGRSVLPVDFEYEVGGERRIDRGFLHDYEKTFELSSSSYFADFRGSVNQDLLDLDRLRYFDISVDELLSGYSCKLELLLEDLVHKESVDQVGENRSFDLSARYRVRVTLPVLSVETLYIKELNLFVSEEKVWERPAVEL